MDFVGPQSLPCRKFREFTFSLYRNDRHINFLLYGILFEGREGMKTEENNSVLDDTRFWMFIVLFLVFIAYVISYQIP